MLRFLKPSRYSRPSSPSPSSSRSQSRHRGRHGAHELKPRLDIRVPSFGSIFMDTVQHGVADEEDEVSQTAGPSQPRKDREARGELAVEIPVGMGACRVKAIRVKMITEAELTISPERVKEKDIIFERVVEVQGNSIDGIILEEGVQRFDFTLIIPPDLSSHDKHPNGKICHFFVAEVEGVDGPKETQEARSGSRSHSRTPRHRSSTHSRARTSTATRGLSVANQSHPETPDSSGTPQEPGTPHGGDSGFSASSLSAALDRMAMVPEDKGSTTNALEVPPYDTEHHEVPWFRGTVETKRPVEVLYNCRQDGGVLELDAVVRDAVPGLGPFEFRLESDCFTIGGLLVGSAKIIDPPPNLTVFSLRVGLIQIHSILSPRDDPATTKPTVTKQNFTIFTCGHRPSSSDKHPPPGVPALWRGKAAFGKNTAGEFVIEGNGRLPSDTLARPSTVQNVKTPIHVAHRLAVEVLFSVWGEDQQGHLLAGGGPGTVRALMVEKQTLVASCAFTPEELRLPTYGSLLHQDAFSHLARKCPLCGKEPNEKLCPTCPPTSVPHPRHDHPPKLVGNDQGVCPLCAEEVVPRREANHDDCACGMSTGYLIERWNKQRPNHGLERATRDEELELSRKVESERGRQR